MYQQINQIKYLLTGLCLLFFLTANAQQIQKNQKAALALNIAGHYVAQPLDDEDSACDLEVTIIKVKDGGYRYKFMIAGKMHSGKVKVSRCDEPKTLCLEFLGIPWASYEGNIANLKDDEEPPKLKIPNSIDGYLKNGEIMIQNSGNAMNAYTKIDACDSKYIRLVKQ